MLVFLEVTNYFSIDSLILQRAMKYNKDFCRDGPVIQVRNVSLKDELERIFRAKDLTEVSSEEMKANMKELEHIHKQAGELDRKNRLLKAKYDNDAKYARLHKRLMEKNPLTDSENKLFEALQSLKKEVDAEIEKNAGMLENENYVEKLILRLIVSELKTRHGLPLNTEQSKAINLMVVKEYLNEYHGRVA